LLDERDLDFLSQIDHAKIHVAEALEAFKFRKALGEAMKFVAE
jgi:methionyl-tRNA synthetase